jgi:hypothetical protein
MSHQTTSRLGEDEGEEYANMLFVDHGLHLVLAKHDG